MCCVDSMRCGVVFGSPNVSYLSVMPAAACLGGVGMVWETIWEILRLYSLNRTDFLVILSVFLLCYPPVQGILKFWVRVRCWQLGIVIQNCQTCWFSVRVFTTVMVDELSNTGHKPPCTGTFTPVGIGFSSQFNWNVHFRCSGCVKHLQHETALK